ncbi:MAG TPA: AMP-binding protein, partial [Dehalococcoidia bacterium]|nr:AMP-binding protein [Dehalococcoidia bacterium]
MPDFDLVNPIVRNWQRRASEDPDAFWAEAAELLPWFRKWDRVFDWQPPTFRWFIGGETNLSYSCLDHNLKIGRGGHAALIACDERGERRVYTYVQLLHEVKRTAAALRGLGIGKGDRVALYMPTCVEALVLMLACLRIGAIHLVVFAGFGANALAERMRLAGAKALFASDITYRRGKDVSLLSVVAEAAESAKPEHVVVLRRTEEPLPGRAIAYDEFLMRGEGLDDGYVSMESNEPAYILATSGTTATPKLAVHTHGAYQVYIHAMARWQFGLRPDEVWWATSDIGWVVGHSFMVYAPLLMGCTTIIYEGAIDYPDVGTFFRIASENGVT